MKIGLGTVQFGLNYGVSNNQGIPTQTEVRNIISFAHAHQIKTLDTAHGYGESEKAIGDATNMLDVDNHIVTKLSPESSVGMSYEQQFQQSLSRLKRQSVYAVMLHDANDLLNHKTNSFEFLTQLKQQGLCQKIGISCYCPEQLTSALEHFDIDIVQVPLNIFDQRFNCPELVYQLKKKQVEIHARSIFLQGLLLMNEHQRPAYFSKYQPVFTQFENYLRQIDLSPIEACLSFAKSTNFVDKFIIGVTSLHELKKIIKTFNNVPKHDFSICSSTEEQLITPYLWQLP